MDIASGAARLKAQTGVQIAISSPVAGTTRPVRGQMTAREAIDAMLAGTGLAVRWMDGSATIIAMAAGDGQQIGTVRVGAAAAEGGDGGNGAVPRGANGSSDPVATEKTHSYTATKINIGGKIAESLKEVPQSVTVITRQRIEDQQLNTLSDVLEQTPGITVVVNNNNNQFNPSYYSRGYLITNFQIDGGAPITYGSGSNYSSTFTPVFDMSQYDHVEVIRGADGTFAGTGDPGGALSLERKRPTSKTQFLGELGSGSYNALRVSGDLSGPVIDDGLVKARLVLTHDQRNYFYRTANKKLDLAYLNIEIDPSTRTRFNIGASYTEQTGVPWSTGLPRNSDGSDAHFALNTCLCVDYGKYQVHELELFVQGEQHFGSHITLNANLSLLQQKTHNLQGSAAGYGGVDVSGTPLYGSVTIARSTSQSKQYVADIFATGKFVLFGNEQNIVVGFNYQKQDDRQSPEAGDGTYTYPVTTSLYAFDPNAYPLPADSEFSLSDYTVPVDKRTQIAGYATLKLTPFRRLHISAGIRYNAYDTQQTTVYTSTSGSFSTNVKYHEGHLIPPLVGITYDLTHRMSVYASYASIYQSQALYRTTNGSVLKPVTGTNIEAGIKRSDLDGRLTSSLAVYRIVQKNIGVVDYSVSSTTDAGTGITCCYSPYPDTQKSKGFDFEILGAITPRWQLSFGYTHNNIKFYPGVLSKANGETTSTLTTQAPKDLVKLFTSYRLGTTGWLGKVTIGGGGRWQSATTETGYVCDALGNCTQVVISQGKYALLDMFTNIAVTPRISAQINVNNIFNKRYYSTIGSIGYGNYYGDPRNFGAIIRMKF